MRPRGEEGGAGAVHTKFYNTFRHDWNCDRRGGLMIAAIK